MTKAKGVLLAIGVFVLCVAAQAALAQTHPAAASNTVDLTQIIVALINLAFPLVGAVATYLINDKVKNQQLAAMLSNAVQNGVGIIQQKAVQAAQSADFTVPVGSPLMQQGVDYVLANAAEAIKHFNIDPASDRIAQKISAKLGLASVATNLAATASPTPVIAGPLAPVALHAVSMAPAAA